jgi:hypothetical protein
MYPGKRFLSLMPSNFIAFEKSIVFIGRFIPIAMASVAIRRVVSLALNLLASSRLTSDRFP